MATGVLMMDRSINVFNLFAISPFLSDPATIARYTQVHVLSCVLLLLMLVLHIGAVVLHEKRGKRVMARMSFHKTSAAAAMDQELRICSANRART